MAENPQKIRPTLTGMEVGDQARFPIEQMKSVRTQASELSAILDRTYKTSTDRKERVISVPRTA